MSRPITKPQLDRFWLDNYCSPHISLSDPGGCWLCGNSGIIDTRESLGPFKGRRGWCLCPNGRGKRKGWGANPPEKP